MTWSQLKTLPTLEYFHECFEYHPDSGDLVWKARPQSHFPTLKGMRKTNSCCAGKKAGWASKGYLKVRIAGVNYFVHRIAVLLMTGSMPPDAVDHINGDGADNRWENLRCVSRRENQKNLRMRRTNTSGVMGVGFRPGRKQWSADISVDGKIKHLGRFETKEEAALARKCAEIEHGFHPNHGSARP
jgi:hypothetical protein